METFLENFVLWFFCLPLIVFLGVIFTRERDNKLGYFIKSLAVFGIMQICTLFTFPLYGNIFGLSSILLSSVVLGTIDLRGLKWKF